MAALSPSDHIVHRLITNFYSHQAIQDKKQAQKSYLSNSCHSSLFLPLWKNYSHNQQKAYAEKQKAKEKKVLEDFERALEQADAHFKNLQFINHKKELEKILENQNFINFLLFLKLRRKKRLQQLFRNRLRRKVAIKYARIKQKESKSKTKNKNENEIKKNIVKEPQIKLSWLQHLHGMHYRKNRTLIGKSPTHGRSRLCQ